jgi:hypothetical protein
MLALLQLASPHTALAQSTADVENARALFVEGAKLAGEGRWKEARELYARSLQLKPAPITRYSLGVAQRETGRRADALGSFRAFLAEPQTNATASYAEPARAAIATLEGQIGHVLITVEPRAPAGLTLSIDGEPVPPTWAAPREIDAGAHDLVARAPGFRAANAHFVSAAGAGVAVAVTLAPTTSPTGSRALVQPLDVAVLLSPPPAARTPSRTLPVVLLSVGSALLVTGTTVGILGVNQASNAPTRDGAAASAAQAKGIAGDLLGGAGIATAGIGLLLLLTGSSSSAAPSSSAGLSVSASGVGFNAHF